MQIANLNFRAIKKNYGDAPKKQYEKAKLLHVTAYEPFRVHVNSSNKLHYLLINSGELRIDLNCVDLDIFFYWRNHFIRPRSKIAIGRYLPTLLEFVYLALPTPQ